MLKEIKKLFGGKTVSQIGLNSPNHLARGYGYRGIGVNQVSNEISNWKEKVKRIYQEAETSARNSQSGWLVTEAWIPFLKMKPGSPDQGEPMTSPKGGSYDELQDEFYQIAVDEYLSFAGQTRPSGFFFTQYLMPWAKVKGRASKVVLKHFFQKI